MEGLGSEITLAFSARNRLFKADFFGCMRADLNFNVIIFIIICLFGIQYITYVEFV